MKYLWGKLSQLSHSLSLPLSIIADASPGCRAPDVRFTIVKPEITTEQPYAKFETTQVYLPEDFTTADVEFVDNKPHSPNENHAAFVNPYAMDFGEEDAHHHNLHAADAAASASLVDDTATMADDKDDLHGAELEDGASKRLNTNRKQGKKRRSGSGRRRRLENDNGQTGRERGSRYKRHAILHDEQASSDTDRWAGSKLAADGDVYYVHIADILKSREPNRQLRAKLHKLKQQALVNKCLAGSVSDKCKKLLQKLKQQTEQKQKQDLETVTVAEGKAEQLHHRRRGDSHAAELDQRDLEPHWQRPRPRQRRAVAKGDAGQLEEQLAQLSQEQIGNQSSSAAVALQRVKRKSGKTTGALSRPKGGGDSSSKTTSRKDKGKDESKHLHSGQTLAMPQCP